MLNRPAQASDSLAGATGAGALVPTPHQPSLSPDSRHSRRCDRRFVSDRRFVIREKPGWQDFFTIFRLESPFSLPLDGSPIKIKERIEK